MSTTRYFSGAPWEQSVGYCRAIRRGNVIAVSGTTSVRDGKVWAPGDPFAQALRCFETAVNAIESLGADRFSVIRTRMYVTDISMWREFARAHGEYFAEVMPATSMVEVKALIDPEMLIEVELDAIVEENAEL